MKLVSDDAVQAALEWLATSSRECAAAKGMVVRLEYRRKALRARLTAESNLPTVSAREAAAEASDAYQAACEAEAVAVEQDEFFRSERNKCAAILDCWRSECANNRTGKDFR